MKTVFELGARLILQNINALRTYVFSLYFIFMSKNIRQSEKLIIQSITDMIKDYSIEDMAQSDIHQSEESSRCIIVCWKVNHSLLHCTLQDFGIFDSLKRF